MSAACCHQVSEDLSTELASVKAFYERALEQLSLAENSKKLQEQQVQLAEQERKRLQREVDRLAQVQHLGGGWVGGGTVLGGGEGGWGMSVHVGVCLCSVL